MSSCPGGEKSLVAIAIYFAIMKVSPPPFCMLGRGGVGPRRRQRRPVRQLSAPHERRDSVYRGHPPARVSMEEADVLYGVTMQEKGVSKILEMNVQEIAQKLKL